MPTRVHPDGRAASRQSLGENAIALAIPLTATSAATGGNDHVRLWHVDGMTALLAVVRSAPRTVTVLAIEPR